MYHLIRRIRSRTCRDVGIGNESRYRLFCSRYIYQYILFLLSTYLYTQAKLVRAHNNLPYTMQKTQVKNLYFLLSILKSLLFSFSNLISILQRQFYQLCSKTHFIFRRNLYEFFPILLCHLTLQKYILSKFQFMKQLFLF